MRDEDIDEDSADIRVEAVIFSLVSFFILVDFRGREVGFFSWVVSLARPWDFADVCFSGNLGGIGSAGSTDNFEVVRWGGAGAVFGRIEVLASSRFVSFVGPDEIAFLLPPIADFLAIFVAFVAATIDEERDEFEAERGLGGFFSSFSRISGSEKENYER